MTNGKKKVSNQILLYSYEIFKFLCVFQAFSLQFVVPISFIFILFDFLLFLFSVAPAFVPSKYMTGKFFEVRNYERITGAILFIVALIINFTYWDLVKIVLINLMR